MDNIKMIAPGRSEATVWLTTGEKLTFHCEAARLAITRNVVEVRREKVGVPHRTFIPIAARVLSAIKREVANAIRKYRSQFLFPVPPVEERYDRQRPIQLSLHLVR